MKLGFLKLIFPFNRCKLVSIDTILSVPESFKDRIIQLARIISFKRVHLFIEYFKNTEGYRKYFRIKSEKLRYVPFKINLYESILNTKVSDRGYVFCGGKTRRDFATLVAAIRDLRYPVKIVCPANADIRKHGSFLNENSLPPNIEIIHDVYDYDSFNQYIAASRLVVLPIKKPNISASGISVYLTSMALRKCVIISAGPGVNDILINDEAIIVPPEDPPALRQAIMRAYNDDDYRRSFEENGYNYAMKLEGEERLYRSIIDVVLKDFTSRQ